VDVHDTRNLPLEQPCWAAELVSPAMSVGLMDDLSILIARLGWPSTSARWWTMQELAAQAIDEGLTEMPDGFKVPDDFNGVQGVDLPKESLIKSRTFHTHTVRSVG